MIKTIIFDLGNVLVSYQHSRIISRIGALCRPESRPAAESIFHGEVIRNYDTGRISSTEFFEIIRDLHGIDIDFEEFAGIWNCTFSKTPILAESLIEKLAERYRLLILSDTNELHFEFIRREISILRWFDEFVLSYQVGHLKPTPEIFRAALDKADCLPEECLFTDDRADNVAGAVKAGLEAFQFVSPEQFERELRGRNLL